MLAGRCSLLALVTMCISGICHGQVRDSGKDAGNPQRADLPVMTPDASGNAGGMGGGILARQQARSQVLAQQIQQQQNPNAIPASQGLQWSSDGSRPSLEYKMDDKSSMRLRAGKHGLRLMFGKQF